MKVSNWDIEDLRPYEKNPRINDHAVEAVTRSLREFGFRQPIVVDSDGGIAFSYKVAGSPNRANIVIGGITVPAKKGWEYLWVRYADGDDAQRVVKVPIAAYVEKVYELGNFAGL